MAIIVTEVDGSDLIYLHNVLHEAINQGQSVKVSQHSGTGQIMVKRGGSTWTPLFGKDVTERVCSRCGTPVKSDGHGSWVDSTDGDGCDDSVHTI